MPSLEPALAARVSCTCLSRVAHLKPTALAVRLVGPIGVWTVELFLVKENCCNLDLGMTCDDMICYDDDMLCACYGQGFDGITSLTLILTQTGFERFDEIAHTYDCAEVEVSPKERERKMKKLAITSRPTSTSCNHVENAYYSMVNLITSSPAMHTRIPEIPAYTSI
uniref:Uncharacterized protein n=1 Tax=Cucumis melo TaxID=3656 RepID=A0A9I9EJ80_CUCME